MSEQKNLVDTFISRMKQKGWDIAWNETQDKCILEIITDRYTNIPEEWLEFAGSIRHMVSPDETTWFLGTEDFDVQGDQAFRWNEWERISLESAGDDAEWTGRIKEFWDQHLPIVMSVKGGYSYYAISMADGSVVHGSEPEFEACEVVAPSFAVFIAQPHAEEICR